MKTKVFEYVFGRKGGVSFDLLQTLETFDSSNFIAFDKVDALYRIIKEELNISLYNYIGKSQNRNIQNLLLNIKRDVFNNRDIKKYSDSFILLDDNITKSIQQYIEIQKEKADIESLIQSHYMACLKRSVLQLKKISEMFFIRNGLLFSSDSMAKNIEKFNLEEKYLNVKKEEKMVNSLLRYITRSGAKTSPFSSYNNIFALRQDEHYFSPVHVSNSSMISINNLVYLIFNKILLSISQIKKSFFIFLNPTIKTKDSYLNYFYNSDNNEAFFNANKSKILEYVIDLLTKNEALPYDELSDNIGKVTEETKENVNKYLDNLIENGLIIIDLPVFISDNEWPDKLLKILGNIQLDNQDVIEGLISILTQLIDSKNILEQVIDVKKREYICNKSYSIFISKLEEIIQVLNQPKLCAILNKITASDLFYEDTMTDKIPIFKYPISNTVDKITHLCRIFQCSTIKSEFRKIFAQRIREMDEEPKIPLLQFYQDIFLNNDFYENVLFNFQTGFIALFDDFFKSLHSLKNQEEIDIEPFIFDIQPDNPVSFDFFTQITTLNDTNVFVVNSIQPEGGTNISRFLNLFPQYTIDRKLKQELKLYYGNSVIANITDAAIHNTNSFSPLTDCIIDVSLKNGDFRTNINLSDLYICIDPKKHVHFEDSSGNEIIPINFSMETMSRKSSLMKFIDLFNDNNLEGLATLLHLYENILITLNNNEPVIVIPRLCYTNGIILSRKKWFVRKSFLKSYLYSQESESLQFKLFNEWRKKIGIPKHFFVKENEASNRGEYSKPQYINAEAPIYFRLLKKQFELDDDFIVFSEMLPSPEQLVTNEKDERFVMEYIFSIMDKK